MLTHDQIWRGVDRLALHNKLSPSGLAKRAGLDPTTFNKSKRVTREGKLRWPSTESLAKILDATQTQMADFVALIDDNAPRPSASASMRLRSLRLSQIADGAGFDTAGFPVGTAWEEIDFPLIEDNAAYAIELDQDVAPPSYRSGDLVVVSPSSSVRRHDRVVVRERNRPLRFAVVKRRTAQRFVFQPLDDLSADYHVDVSELAWIGRIIWVSQ